MDPTQAPWIQALLSQMWPGAGSNPIGMGGQGMGPTSPQDYPGMYPNLTMQNMQTMFPQASTPNPSRPPQNLGPQPGGRVGGSTPTPPIRPPQQANIPASRGANRTMPSQTGRWGTLFQPQVGGGLAANHPIYTTLNLFG